MSGALALLGADGDPVALLLYGSLCMLKNILNVMAGAGLKPAWVSSSPRPPSLEPVRLPRDERPHERAVEWWHFMGRLWAPEDLKHTNDRIDRGKGMTFIATTLKGRFQGITKLAGVVILIDHEREHYATSAKVSSLGASYLEPDDGRSFLFHFGPRGPSRKGPPEAWSISGGMGLYRLDLDVGEQLSLSLSPGRLDSAAARSTTASRGSSTSASTRASIVLISSG